MEREKLSLLKKLTTMNIYKNQKVKSHKLKGNDHFEGICLERELEQQKATGVKHDNNLTQIFYTQRKDGVLAECNIRTDTMEIAQNAMSKANSDFQKAIQNKMNPQQDSQKID